MLEGSVVSSRLSCQYSNFLTAHLNTVQALEGSMVLWFLQDFLVNIVFLAALKGWGGVEGQEYQEQRQMKICRQLCILKCGLRKNYNIVTYSSDSSAETQVIYNFRNSATLPFPHP